MFFKHSQLQSLVGLVLLKKKQTHAKKPQENTQLLSVRKIKIKTAESCLHPKMQMFLLKLHTTET